MASRTDLSFVFAVACCLTPCAAFCAEPHGRPVRPGPKRSPATYRTRGTRPSPLAGTRLTPRQADQLAGVRDHTPLIDEAGLYVLLDQAKRLSANGLVRAAVAVRRDDLLEQPDAYRGRLVKITAHYAESQSFRPANRRRHDGLAYSTLAWERDSLEPVSIVTVEDPGAVGQRASVVLVGYFFKLRRDERREPDPKTGQTELAVPVLVGRALVIDRQAARQGDPADFRWVALVGGVVLLAALWFGLRTRLSRQERERRDKLGRRERWAAPSDPSAPENRPIDLEAIERSEDTAGDDRSAAPASGPGSCPKCGAPHRPAARFCDQCGGVLD